MTDVKIYSPLTGTRTNYVRSVGYDIITSDYVSLRLPERQKRSLFSRKKVTR